ncbi:uncharacterized protein LOC128884297 isoform X2 [Hylaeus volcanicus]|uniref:uncharacterized protein LOC128884297 isoform X2 n=1 Tax=Hylaeus volcanicus TaxID=313075 RepID=UPI0023B80E26|nr:uncharacterized protein LOC128884297 isoform X2 [Hylaeus volcanicus]
MDPSNDFSMSIPSTSYKIHRSLSLNDVSIKHQKQGTSDSGFNLNSSENLTENYQGGHGLTNFFLPKINSNKKRPSVQTSTTFPNFPYYQCNTGINNMENHSSILETISQKNSLCIPILKKKYSLNNDYLTVSKKYYENREEKYLNSNSFYFTDALLHEKPNRDPYSINKTKKVNDCTTTWDSNVTSPTSHNLFHSVLSDKRLEQVKKHITFTTNVVTEAVHVSHLCGVANAPTVSMESQLNINDDEGNQLLVNETPHLSLSKNFQEKIQHIFSMWSDKRETRWTPLETKPPQHVFSTTDVEHVSFRLHNFNKGTSKMYTSDYLNQEQPHCATHAIDDSRDQKALRSLSLGFQKCKRKKLFLKHICQKSKNNFRNESNVKFVIPLQYKKREKRFFNFITKRIPMTINPLVCGFKKKKKGAFAFSALNPTITRLNELVLMTFNVGLLEYCFGGISWYRNPPFTKFRLQHIAPALKNSGCHIIALQEVYDEWQANFLISFLKVVFPFVARCASGGMFSLHNGLMLMSQFPILRSHFHSFHSVTTLEKIFGSKGILEATVEIPTVGKVTIFNVHLASGAIDPQCSSVELLRYDEILQIFDVCSVAKNRGEIPLIMGDLNAAPNICSSNYKAFLSKGWRDALLLALRKQKINEALHELEAFEVWQLLCKNEDFVHECINSIKQLSHSSSVIHTDAFVNLLKENNLYSAFHKTQKAQMQSWQSRVKTIEQKLIVSKPSKILNIISLIYWYSNKETTEKQKKKLQFQHTVVLLKRYSNFMAHRRRREPINSFLKSQYTNDSPTPRNSRAARISRFPKVLRVSHLKSAYIAFIPAPSRQSIVPSLFHTKSTTQFLSDKPVWFPYPSRRFFLRHYSCSTDISSDCSLNKSLSASYKTQNSKHSSGDKPYLKYFQCDPFSCSLYTWDPQNPLNVIGPHAECHGLRCDHILLPPQDYIGELGSFEITQADVMFQKPEVPIQGFCCGLAGNTSLVTLSDHYGVRVTLSRFT